MHFITSLLLKRCSRAFYHLLSITETSKRALLLLLSGMAEQRNRLPDPLPFLSLLHSFITDNCKPCCINNYLNSTGSVSFIHPKYAHMQKIVCMLTTDNTDLICSGTQMTPSSMVKTLAFAPTLVFIAHPKDYTPSNNNYVEMLYRGNSLL